MNSTLGRSPGDYLRIWLALAACVLLLALPVRALADTCPTDSGGNWSSSGNWDCNNHNRPLTGDDVIISNGDSILVNLNTPIIRNLTIQSGATLRGGNYYTLSMSGNFTNNGTFTAQNGTVAFAGTNQTLTGNTTFYNLNLGTTALTLAGNVVVTGTLSGTVNLVSTCPNDYTLTWGSTVYHSCAACTAQGTGLYGSYYNNTTGGASPSFPSGNPALIRLDPQVNFSWGTASPGTGVNAENFMVRWVGEVQATAAGTYRFQTVSDDGVRLWINGAQVIDNWMDHSSTTDTSVNVSLGACQKVPVVMEYYEHLTTAEARLQWLPPGSSSYVAIPQVRLYPSAPTVDSAQVADCDFKTVLVRFSHTMQNDAGTNGILNVANYALTSGGSVVAISGITSSDGITAQLTLTAALNPANNASVTVSNVKDAAGVSLTAPATLAINLNPGGFIGKYYNWTGTPPPATDNPSSTPALTRFDSSINFDWSNTGSPGVALGAEQFQARWGGTVTIPTSGFYTFYATSDDGQRLWINNVQLVDDWVLHSETERTTTPQYFTAGQKVKIDYAMFENTGYAVAKLYWQAGTTSGGSDIIAKQPVSGGNACTVATAPPANFNAFETATPAGAISGVIKTKIAAQEFTLDVVALTDTPAVKTDFVGTVSLELVNGSGTTACASRTQIADAGSITFAAANNGRMNATFTENNAWPDVLVRMTYTPSSGSPVVACSSDHFAIRPASFGVAVTDSNWETAGTARTLDNASVAGGTVHKAGRPFTITATAYNAASTPAITTNYAGAPSAIITGYVLPTSCTACTLSGVAFTGSGGTVVSATTSYNEVGVFKLQLQDAQFAIIDAADSTIAERTITSPEINVGRFIPDHFTLQSGSAASGKCNGFTYMDQPGMTVNYDILAQNYASGTTANYSYTASSNLARSAVVVVAEDADNSVDLGARLAPSLPSTSWLAGEYRVSISVAAFSRLTAPDGPYDSLLLGIKVVDPDAPVLADLNMNAATTGDCVTAGNCDSKRIGDTTGGAAQPTMVRFGRLKLSNAYGSERLSLAIPMRAEYWNQTNGVFVTNTLDSCTSVAAGNIGMPAYSGGVTSANMTVGSNVTVGSSFSSGIGSLKLARPNPASTSKGSVDVCVDLGDDVPVTPARCVASTPLAFPWLKGRWTGGDYVDDPRARATFGVYKNSDGRGNGVIYFREMY